MAQGFIPYNLELDKVIGLICFTYMISKLYKFSSGDELILCVYINYVSKYILLLVITKVLS